MIQITIVHKVKKVAGKIGCHLSMYFLSSRPRSEKDGICTGYSFELPFLLTDLKVSYIIAMSLHQRLGKFVYVFLSNGSGNSLALQNNDDME